MEEVSASTSNPSFQNILHLDKLMECTTEAEEELWDLGMKTASSFPIHFPLCLSSKA